jgi:hypothetical protein
MSTSKFTHLEKPLGRSLKEFQLSILSFPPVKAPITNKARAFDYTIDAMHGHLNDYGFNEISSFITGCVPGHCGAAASEANAYGSALRRSIFELHNIEGLFFSFLKGTKAKEADLDTNPALRAPDITTFTIRSTVDQNKVAPASVTISQPSFEVEITLPLPHSRRQHFPSLHPRQQVPDPPSQIQAYNQQTRLHQNLPGQRFQCHRGLQQRCPQRTFHGTDPEPRRPLEPARLTFLNPRHRYKHAKDARRSQVLRK